MSPSLHRNQPPSRWLWRACIALVLTSGCGESPPSRVTGTVTMDGKPLANTFVVFETNSGRSSVGKTDEQGRYELRYNSQLMGAELGEYVVRFRDASSSDDSGNAKKKIIPKQYDEESNILQKVAPGNNVLNFELTSK